MLWATVSGSVVCCRLVSLAAGGGVGWWGCVSESLVCRWEVQEKSCVMYCFLHEVRVMFDNLDLSLLKPYIKYHVLLTRN